MAHGVLRDDAPEHQTRPRPAVEELESREVPAAFPWPDGSHLTLSFAPDGTSIAGQPSNFFQTANQKGSAAAWE